MEGITHGPLPPARTNPRTLRRAYGFLQLDPLESADSPQISHQSGSLDSVDTSLSVWTSGLPTFRLFDFRALHRLIDPFLSHHHSPSSFYALSLAHVHILSLPTLSVLPERREHDETHFRSPQVARSRSRSRSPTDAENPPTTTTHILSALSAEEIEV